MTQNWSQIYNLIKFFFFFEFWLGQVAQNWESNWNLIEFSLCFTYYYIYIDYVTHITLFVRFSMLVLTIIQFNMPYRRSASSCSTLHRWMKHSQNATGFLCSKLVDWSFSFSKADVNWGSASYVLHDSVMWWTRHLLVH